MPFMRGSIGNSTEVVNGYLTGCDGKPERSSYDCMLRDVVRRVEDRLKAVGLSASAASRMAGLSPDAIRNMQRAVQNPTSRQGVTTRTLAALAPVLETTTGWLLEGRGEGPRMVDIVGHVGAGGEAHFGCGQGPFGQIEAPDGATDKTVAVEVQGDSLGPVFNGWYVFYDDIRSPVTPDLHGQLCVVGLEGDRVLVKQLKPSRTSGRFHLISQDHAEPLFDQVVVWAAQVIAMKPK